MGEPLLVFAVGDRVRILQDGDGAANSFGTVRTVFRSGRCTVDLDAGGFRNIHPSNMERATTDYEIPG